MVIERSVDELLAVLHARLHNELSVFTTTADLHLIDAAYARTMQQVTRHSERIAWHGMSGPRVLIGWAQLGGAEAVVRRVCAPLSCVQ